MESFKYLFVCNFKMKHIITRFNSTNIVRKPYHTPLVSTEHKFRKDDCAVVDYICNTLGITAFRVNEKSAIVLWQDMCLISAAICNAPSKLN